MGDQTIGEFNPPLIDCSHNVGGVLYYALQENTAVGAGCFIGFGSRIVLEHLKKRDIHKFALSLLGLALGQYLSNKSLRHYIRLNTISQAFSLQMF